MPKSLVFGLHFFHHGGKLQYRSCKPTLLRSRGIDSATFSNTRPVARLVCIEDKETGLTHEVYILSNAYPPYWSFDCSAKAA